MKEMPMLFNGAMVRALLDGSKTQTRRAMKRQPDYPIIIATDPHTNRYQIGEREPVTEAALLRECPYGQPGDRIWVRETWRTDASLDAKPPRDFSGWPVKYEADGTALRHGAHFGKTDGKTRVCMHMPRWASRILLEIVSVRVERLNECSESDARAEGATHLAAANHLSCGGWSHDGHYVHETALASFEQLWKSINGAGSWAASPWVWVIEFKRVTP